MTTRMWTKPRTQELIKELRHAGWTIEKRNGIYKIINNETDDPWVMDNKPLFTAMPGTRGYLVRYHPDVMS